MIAPRLIPLSVFAVLLAAGNLPAVGAQSEKQRFTLGVMRTDGILIPFAAYDDGDWSMPWPLNIGGTVEVPANLAAIPNRWWGKVIPPDWRVVGGNTPAPFKLVAPIAVRMGGVRRLGVRTDFRAPTVVPMPRIALPIPKEGLAVGGNADVQSIVAVSRLVPEWKAMAARVRADAFRAEERQISLLRSRTGWRHPFRPEVRDEVELELEAWYTSALEEPGTAASYIEAVKKYPLQPEDQGCGLETFVTGWVYHEPKRERPRTDLSALVVYCDRENASYMLPLGLMRLRNRTYWAFQKSGHDHEWYVVAEMRPGRAQIVVEYPGGAIPTRMIR